MAGRTKGSGKRKIKKGQHGGWRPGGGAEAFLKDATRVTTDFDGTDVKRLRTMARKRGVSVSALVREAVKGFLKRKGKRHVSEGD